MNSPYLNMVSTSRRSQRNGFVLGSQSDKKNADNNRENAFAILCPGLFELQSYSENF